MHLKNSELYFLSVIKGEKRGFFASLLRTALFLMSGPFRLGVSLRNWMYDHGWLKSYIPPVPLVISIGNITTGGTGKTPVTLMIAKQLQEVASLAVLSRGYRSQAEKLSSPIVLSKSRGNLHPASLSGDEPTLLADNLPESIVIVGRDRYLSSKVAAKMGAEVLLLDDGMQHRGIARDLEVVVMDLHDPFGQGYFLPRGLLREGRSALRRADLIVLNHADDLETFERLKRKISNSSSAPVVGTTVEVVGVFDLEGQKVSLCRDDPVGIFCGIAHPEYFEKTVHRLGGVSIDRLFFPDHDSMDLEALMEFSERCKANGAKWLLCTEKDRVKLTDVCDLKLPVAFVKTELKVVAGEHYYNAFVERAKTKLQDKL